MDIKRVSTTEAPTPAGHYSQAVVHNGLVYVAGQLAIDPKSGEKKLGSAEEQAEQTLRNVAAILEAAGSGLDCLLKVTIYISENEYWAPVNAVFARMLGDHRPARAIVPVKDLHYGLKLEMDAIAAVRGASS